MEATGVRKSKRIAKINTRDNTFAGNDDENEAIKSAMVVYEEGSGSKKRKNALSKIKKDKKGKKAKKNTTTSIRVRTTPNPLFNAIRSLSVEQEQCLIDMGFGGLINMKLDGIPSILALHAAVNFDPYEMVIKTSKGPIRITKQAINDMIGAPMGHINYDTCSTEDFGAANKEEWKKQFNKESVRATEVSRQIVISNDADWNFMLNFIVLFCNTMGSCKYNGLCDLDVLSRVKRETNFQEIDWCGYIYQCLEYCKNKWSGNDGDKFFCGPLTTLVLLYVDNIKCNVPQITRVRPAIKAWSHELLKMRMEAEIESGGLGLGELNEPYNNIMSGLPPASPVNIEEYLSKMNESYEKMISIKRTIITTLQKASSKFPESSDIDEWRRKHLDVFVNEEETVVKEKRNVEGVVIEEGNTQQQMDLHVEDFGIENEIEIREGLEDLSETQFFEDTNVIQSCDMAQKEAEQKKKDNSRSENPFAIRQAPLSPSMPSFSIGMTQLFGEDTYIHMEGDAHGDATIPMNETMTDEVMTEIPKEPEQHKEGLTIKLKLKGIQRDCETPNDNQNKGQTMENQGQKRAIKAALPICSPYLDRKVDANATVTKDETMVANWIFAMQGDKMDGVFKLSDGAEAPKVVFESMAPNTDICASVIDIWSYILNREEELRDRASPHRLFCPTTTLSEDMIPPHVSTNAMVKRFSSNLKDAMTNVEEMASLRNIDMIFIPIMRPGHFYLCVFNLKNPSFVILDNSATDVTVNAKYGDLPEMLKLALVEYLKDVGHPRVKSMIKVKPNRYKMKWRTIKNTIDCGIFVMRHMETYKGETEGRYDCGFEKESGSQDIQLKKLRHKYLCKILLSAHNTLKDKVIKNVTHFSNIDGKMTKKMIQDARKSKELRLA